MIGSRPVDLDLKATNVIDMYNIDIYSSLTQKIYGEKGCNEKFVDTLSHENAHVPKIIYMLFLCRYCSVVVRRHRNSYRYMGRYTYTHRADVGMPTHAPPRQIFP